MINKIVIISASGIGNTILFTPVIIALRNKLPNVVIDLLVGKHTFGECVNGSDLVNNIYIIPENLTDMIRFIVSKKRAYDVSITVFPSNKWQFNVFAFLLGARSRVTHSYGFGKIRTLSFLQNRKVPAISSLHDVYQNLNLLKGISIQLDDEEPQLYFQLSKNDIELAGQYLQDNRILEDNYIIGVHVGAGPIGDSKKWGINNFAAEINRITSEHKNNAVILFGAENETAERRELASLVDCENTYIFNGTLKQTAALISRCNFFLSNDTGLMHIAACFGIKQKSIFISTNPTRTAPYNKNAVVQIEGDCSCYRYPFWSTK